MATNKSGIRPVEFKVLVKPDGVEKTSAGGIIIPDDKSDRDQMAMATGVIAEQSEYAFSAWDNNAPKPGDRVIFAKYAGMVTTGNDGEEYRVMNDKDICAVLE
jgi:chaperonin GroES